MLSYSQSGIVKPGDPDRSENGIGHAEMRERGRAAEASASSAEPMRARQSEIGAQGEPLLLFDFDDFLRDHLVLDDLVVALISPLVLLPKGPGYMVYGLQPLCSH